MSYEFGSDGIGIKNPFRVEGVFKITRGILTLIIGVYILLSAPEKSQINHIIGWVAIATAFLIITFGMVALSKGILQVVRFYVGRNAPASLSYDYADTSKENEECLYKSTELEQMLLNRTNTTFSEPSGVIELLLHTIFPKLIFAPIPIRNIVQNVTYGLVKTGIILISLLLTWIVLSMNVLPVEPDAVLKLYSLLISIYILKVWLSAGKAINKNSITKIQTISTLSFVKTIVLSVSLPITLSVGFNYLPAKLIDSINEMLTISSDQLNSYEDLGVFVTGLISNLDFTVVLLTSLFLSLGVSIYTYMMLALKSDISQPLTETSELRETWEQNIHPKEIFINLDQVVMANRRYKNIPNRSYINFEPQLSEQSGGKGSYRGKFLQETQPVVVENPLSVSHKAGRLFGTVISQVLLFSTSLLLVFVYTDISNLGIELTKLNHLSLNTIYNLGATIATDINYFLISLFIFSIGRLVSNHSHIYWAEVKFKSKLLFLNCEGTYNESRLTVGKGVYDSAQSENIVVKTSNTSICIASEIWTSTFAGVGAKNLELPRYIFDMQAASVDMNSILSELKNNLKSRSKISTFDNEADMKSISMINNINAIHNKESNITNQEKSIENKTPILDSVSQGN